MAKQELVRNASATVGTSNVVVSEECYQQRTAIVITNTSTADQVISISYGQEAKSGVGIRILPGGVYQDTRDGSYLPSNLQINAISDAAGGTIAIHERILMDTYRG